MDSIRITGGKRLQGKIPISGAKNSALTLLPCALLTDEKLTLANLPRLADVDNFSHLLNGLGVSTKVAGVKKGEVGRRMTLEASEIASTVAPYDMVRKMRASILVLGPMLARAGESTVSLPGGCAIGDRPIDLHLKALECMGAEIELAAGYVKAVAPKGRLPGGDYSFPVVSVGATENAVMAAVLATGRTQLFNAAREPEIVDLCNLLVAMGAKIEGIGSSHLIIDGVEGLHGCTYEVMPDRIEAGSYACAAGITGGSIELVGARPADMLAITNGLAAAGLIIEMTNEGMKVTADGRSSRWRFRPRRFRVSRPTCRRNSWPCWRWPRARASSRKRSSRTATCTFPSFAEWAPTSKSAAARRSSRAVSALTGAQVMATDLRASMSLILAGLAAEGDTEVLRVYHLDRGYERLEEKLGAVGAKIERVSAG